MNVFGFFDVILISLVLVATILLFMSDDVAVFGWGGVFCITPWIGRVAMQFAISHIELPVRFDCLGDTIQWRAVDVGIMVLWGILITLTTTAFAGSILLVVGDVQGTIYGGWFVVLIGIMCGGMLRVGVPLVMVGMGSTKALCGLVRR